MPNGVGENQAKKKLAAGEVVLFMGVNQTGGSDVGYILGAGRADVNRIREVRLS
jgi:hypothetical protein